jgi:hypothetical protein
MAGNRHETSFSGTSTSTEAPAAEKIFRPASPARRFWRRQTAISVWKSGTVRPLRSEQHGKQKNRAMDCDATGFRFFSLAG